MSLAEGEADISFLLDRYSDVFLSLIFSPSDKRDRNAVLTDLLNDVSDWGSVEDCLMSDESPGQYQKVAAFGLRLIAEFCELVERGADRTTLVLLWNRITEARFEAFWVQVVAQDGLGKIGRSRLARKAALAKHAASGKSEAKRLVRECWEDWCKHPQQYQRPANFSRAMLDKYEELQSQAVIDRWVRQWETELR
jgi:hypothetical protein